MVSYWLIVPQSKQAFIYRKDGSVDILKSFDEKLSGENVLPGFVFELHNLKLNNKEKAKAIPTVPMIEVQQ